jgi:hypothetical protein
MIEPMSLAALMAGADGLEIEVHIDPPNALSDKEQQLTVAQFEDLMGKLRMARAFIQSLGSAGVQGDVRDDAENGKKDARAGAGKAARAGEEPHPFSDAVD